MASSGSNFESGGNPGGFPKRNESHRKIDNRNAGMNSFTNSFPRNSPIAATDTSVTLKSIEVQNGLQVAITNCWDIESADERNRKNNTHSLIIDGIADPICQSTGPFATQTRELITEELLSNAEITTVIHCEVTKKGCELTNDGTNVIGIVGNTLHGGLAGNGNGKSSLSGFAGSSPGNLLEQLNRSANCSTNSTNDNMDGSSGRIGSNADKVGSIVSPVTKNNSLGNSTANILGNITSIGSNGISFNIREQSLVPSNLDQWDTLEQNQDEAESDRSEANNCFQKDKSGHPHRKHFGAGDIVSEALTSSARIKSIVAKGSGVLRNSAGADGRADRGKDSRGSQELSHTGLMSPIPCCGMMTQLPTNRRPMGSVQQHCKPLRSRPSVHSSSIPQPPINSSSANPSRIQQSQSPDNRSPIALVEFVTTQGENAKPFTFLGFRRLDQCVSLGARASLYYKLSGENQGEMRVKVKMRKVTMIKPSRHPYVIINGTKERIRTSEDLIILPGRNTAEYVTHTAGDQAIVSHFINLLMPGNQAIQISRDIQNMWSKGPGGETLYSSKTGTGECGQPIGSRRHIRMADSDGNVAWRSIRIRDKENTRHGKVGQPSQ